MKWLGISPLSCFKGFNYTILTRLLWDFYESKRFCRKLVHHPPTWWRCQDFLRVSKARRVTHQLVVPGICWEKNPPKKKSKVFQTLGEDHFSTSFLASEKTLGRCAVPGPPTGVWQADGELLLEEVLAICCSLKSQNEKRLTINGNTMNFSRHAFAIQDSLSNDTCLLLVWHLSLCLYICSNRKIQSIECRRCIIIRCCGGQRAWLGPVPQAMVLAIIFCVFMQTNEIVVV